MKMCAVSIVTAAMLASGSAALAQNFVNPGFENGLSGWSGFGNQFADTTTPRTGDGVAKMFGTFTGGFGVSGLFQTFPAAPGQMWTMSGFFRHNTGDALFGNGPANSNWVISKLSFRNAADQEIGFAESAPFDGRNLVDVWTPTSAVGAAPANTVAVQAFFLFIQPNFDGGSVLIDDALLVPAPGVASFLAVGGIALGARRRRAR